MKKNLTLEDLKDWNKFCISKQYFEHDQLDLKCERCAAYSCVDRWVISDSGNLVCPSCFDPTSREDANKDPLIIKPCPAPVLSYPSPEIEKTVITSPPDGIPISSQFGTELPSMDRFGYLKTKDKKARKEIKELRAEVESLTRILRTLGRLNYLVASYKTCTLKEKEDLCDFLLKD